MAEDVEDIDIEEVENLITIDPVDTMATMANIIYQLNDTSAISCIDAKEGATEDCYYIISLCAKIVQKQIKEQYPIYFTTKKKTDAKKDDTKERV